MCLQIIYLIYMHKEELALNHQQWLISQKNKPKSLLRMHLDSQLQSLKKTLQAVSESRRYNDIKHVWRFDFWFISDTKSEACGQPLSSDYIHLFY